MTEWNKMQAHQICNDFDADLFERRVKAKNYLKNLTVQKTTKLNVVRKSCGNSSRKWVNAFGWNQTLPANSAKILRLGTMSILISGVHCSIADKSQ